MNINMLQTIFAKCPMGIAHLEIIEDEQNNTADYRFLEVNKAFLNICGLNQADLIEKTVSQLFPKTEFTVNDWHMLFNRIGKSDKTVEFDYYFKKMQKWCQVHAYITSSEFLTIMLTDISNSKNKNEEQQEREEELIKTKTQTEEINANLTAILEGTTDNIWAFDRNYNILYINKVFQKEFEESFGLKLEKGSNLLNALPEMLRPIWKPRYDKALSNEQHTIIDEIDTAKGKLYIQVTFNPIINNGKVIGGSCFGSNITERKQSEIALKQAQKYLAEKEAQYRLIAENSTDLIYVYQLIPEPHYEYISPSCFQLTGYKPEEGYTDPFVYHKFINTPEGVNRFTQFLLNSDQPTTIEEEWRKKDGTYIWVEQVISRKFDENGNLVSFQSTVRDITDRKNAEKILYTERMRLEGIIKGTKTGTWEWNIQSGNVIYNERWVEIIGYTLEEISPSIETWMKFVHPEDLKISNEILNKHFKGELDYYETEIRMQHKDGHWVWIIDRGKLVSRTDDGKPLMMLGTHQDITERKLAEQTLKESEKMLRELNAQKDKFFSIIAHDLKSPFNSILGFSQLLVEQIQSKDYAGIEEYAKIMLHSSEHAFSLLSNLLEWSRAQSGKIEFNPEFFELIEFIDNIIPIFDGVAKQKSINIIKMLPHNTPIYADKHMISTVLRNFINNAIKFTNQGGKIEVDVRCIHNEVVISVKDNGIGIAKNRIEKLFRIDESESTPGTANEKGTGLGLILCKEFIEKHNGKIWVESDVGIGSAFSISIPAYKRL